MNHEHNNRTHFNHIASVAPNTQIAMSQHATTPFKCINRERQIRTIFIHTASVAPNVQIAICRAHMQLRHFKCINHERQNLYTIYPYSIGGSERANNYMSSMQQRNVISNASIANDKSAQILFIPHRWLRTCKSLYVVYTCNNTIQMHESRTTKFVHNLSIQHRWFRTCK